MQYLIGIDGGGTKTAFALAKTDGTVLRTLELDSTSYREHGIQKVIERLEEGVSTLLISHTCNVLLSSPPAPCPVTAHVTFTGHPCPCPADLEKPPPHSDAHSLSPFSFFILANVCYYCDLFCCL